jgi:hypothetical protein
MYLFLYSSEFIDKERIKKNVLVNKSILKEFIYPYALNKIA